MNEEDETPPPDEAGPGSALFSFLTSVERILGVVIIFCALLVVAIICQGAVPEMQPDFLNTGPAADGISSPGISILLWIVLMVAGVRILVLERHRLRVRLICSWCPEEPPPWGAYDCIKVMALYFVGAYASFMLAVETIRRGGIFLKGLVSNREEIVLSGFLLQTLISVFVVFLLYIRGATLRKLGLESIAFVSGRAKALRVWLGFAPVFFFLALFGSVSIYLVCEIFGLKYSAGPQEVALLMVDGSFSIWTRLVLCIFAIVIAPITEEIIYRGLLYGALRHYFIWPVCALLSGVIFGAVHNGLLQFLPLAGFGILLAVLREHTRGLAVPVMIHSIHNTIMLIMIFSLG